MHRTQSPGMKTCRGRQPRAQSGSGRISVQMLATTRSVPKPAKKVGCPGSIRHGARHIVGRSVPQPGSDHRPGGEPGVEREVGSLRHHDTPARVRRRCRFELGNDGTGRAACVADHCVVTSRRRLAIASGSSTWGGREGWRRGKWVSANCLTKLGTEQCSFTTANLALLRLLVENFE